MKCVRSVRQAATVATTFRTFVAPSNVGVIATPKPIGCRTLRAFSARTGFVCSSSNERDPVMKIYYAILIVLICMVTSVYAQRAGTDGIAVTQLIARDPPELPGRELTMITVEYPPGAADPVHKHHGHGLIYVLEGSVVMQVKGGPAVTLTPGQTFYEGPNDLHVVGRNASQTDKARFLVFFVKDKGAPILTVTK